MSRDNKSKAVSMRKPARVLLKDFTMKDCPGEFGTKFVTFSFVKSTWLERKRAAAFKIPFYADRTIDGVTMVDFLRSTADGIESECQKIESGFYDLKPKRGKSA